MHDQIVAAGHIRSSDTFEEKFHTSTTKSIERIGQQVHVLKSSLMRAPISSSYKIFIVSLIAQLRALQWTYTHIYSLFNPIKHEKERRKSTLCANMTKHITSMINGCKHIGYHYENCFIAIHWNPISTIGYVCLDGCGSFKGCQPSHTLEKSHFSSL